MELKKQLRKKFLNLRRLSKNLSSSLKNETIVKNTQEVIDSVFIKRNKKALFSKKSDLMAGHKVIGIYWPMIGEVDITKLDVNFLTNIALPKIKENEMCYVKYEHGYKVEKSPFYGLMQPKNENKVEPSIVIVPGLSFSLNGSRLGFGSGYYDKYINNISTGNNVIKIGVCFHEYISEYLPREKHDLTLDYVITDKTIIEL